MTYGVQGRLGFSSAARRTTVTTALTNGLAGLTRTGVDEVANFDGRPRFTATSRRFMLRLTTEADADSFWTAVVNALGVTPPAAGSWIDQHSCAHDVAEGCTLKRRTVF